MIIRLIGVLIILALLLLAVVYVAKVYGEEKAKQQERREAKKVNGLSKEQARVAYLEIRRKWLDYTLGDAPEYFALSMNDTTIPEVDRFHKHMVLMQGNYGDLQGVKEFSNVFVAQTVMLQELFDAAVLAAKKKSL